MLFFTGIRLLEIIFCILVVSLYWTLRCLDYNFVAFICLPSDLIVGIMPALQLQQDLATFISRFAKC